MKVLRRFVLGMACLVLIGVLGAGTPAQARTPTEIRSLIQKKMKERHPGDVDAFWNSLGEEALPVLKQWYAENPTPFERGWIVDGLSHFDSPEVASLLQKEIGATGDDVLKRKMLSALIRSQGEGALDFVSPYLDDEDAQIRKAVAQGLKKYASDQKRVQDRLASYLKREKEPWVREAVNKVGAEEKPLLKRADSAVVEATPTPAELKPLEEKAWAGEWKGAWITPGKNSTASAKLVLLNPEALARGDRSVQVWRVELKVARQSKRELKESDFSWNAFTTPRGHWLELRSKKTDAVLLVHRLVSK